MKKLVLGVALLGALVSCQKWENKPTEEKILGIWNGINFQSDLQAAPFFDTTVVESTSDMVANFLPEGGLTIDSAGARIDSMGWRIKNDTILVLDGVNFGLFEDLPGAPSNLGTSAGFRIVNLTEDLLTFRYDTTMSITVPGVPIPLTVSTGIAQRWER